MANSEHLKILNQGVEAWNRWRLDNKGIKPDLSRADLANAELADVLLEGADLQGANLQNADMIRAGRAGCSPLPW